MTKNGHKPILFSLNGRIEADASGKYPTEIELCRTGVWYTEWHGDFEITIDDIDEAIRHFDAGVYRVNLTEPLPGTLDHLGGGSPAAFRINRIYREGEVMMASVTWTALGKEKLDRDEYRYISFEFNPRAYPFVNPENAGETLVNVVSGATMTNDPLFKQQRPILASARAGQRDKSKGESPMDLEALRAKKPEDITEDERKFLDEHKADLTAEERKAFDLQTEEEKAAEAQAEADAKAVEQEEAAAAARAEEEAGASEEAKKVEASAKGVISISTSELEKLKASAARADALALEIATDNARSFVAASVSKGQIKSGEQDRAVKLLLASAPAQRKELEAFITGLPVNESLGKELGDGGRVEASAESELTERANKLVIESNGSLSFSAATKSLMASDSGLRDRINAERAEK